jgi:hypothetical protein
MSGSDILSFAILPNCASEIFRDHAAVWRAVRAQLHLLRHGHQTGAFGALAAGARPMARPGGSLGGPWVVLAMWCAACLAACTAAPAAGRHVTIRVARSLLVRSVWAAAPRNG